MGGKHVLTGQRRDALHRALTIGAIRVVPNASTKGLARTARIGLVRAQPHQNLCPHPVQRILIETWLLNGLGRSSITSSRFSVRKLAEIATMSLSAS